MRLPGREMEACQLKKIPRHWPYFCNFVDLSPCLSFNIEGDQREARSAPDLTLKDGSILTVVVFGERVVGMQESCIFPG